MTIHTTFGTCINVWHILVRSIFCVRRLYVGVMMNIVLEQLSLLQDCEEELKELCDGHRLELFVITSSYVNVVNTIP